MRPLGDELWQRRVWRRIHRVRRGRRWIYAVLLVTVGAITAAVCWLLNA